jgi:hypothetical protein
MVKAFGELRERLLRAGVAPRHVRRYLKELSEHLSDLRAEEVRAGRSPSEAEEIALARLGTVENLARAMIGSRKFQSWSARAPWAAFGLIPLGSLAIAWGVALSILASGWLIFMPRAETPFVPIHGMAIVYFGAGKLIYFSAPLLVGWAIGVIAARQRSNAAWLMAGLVLIAWIGGMARVSAHRIYGTSGMGSEHVSIHSGHLVPGMSGGWWHVAAILGATVLPYLIWRIRRAVSNAE